MKRAALYVRVSSERQTTANQLPGLKKYAKARDLRIVATYEESVSAVKVRPQYDAMLAAAHRAEFDTLLVWSLDRFGRSAIGNLEAVLELDGKGVHVVSLQEQWLEMQGPVRQLLIFIISWVAEQERARLIERTHAGIARARAEGKHIGRPRKHVSAALAHGLELGGRTRAEVARELGVSESTLRRQVKSARPPSEPKNRKRDRSKGGHETGPILGG
jgi:DNA invertase Pin-like site-specific DNA recombinase